MILNCPLKPFIFIYHSCYVSEPGKRSAGNFIFACFLSTLQTSNLHVRRRTCGANSLKLEKKVKHFEVRYLWSDKIVVINQMASSSKLKNRNQKALFCLHCLMA